MLGVHGAHLAADPTLRPYSDRFRVEGDVGEIVWEYSEYVVDASSRWSKDGLQTSGVGSSANLVGESVVVPDEVCGRYVDHL